MAGNKNSNKKRDTWESSYMNNRTYLQYYNRLTELAISMFEWKNLPPSIDPRFLELTLYSDGMAIFFKDEVLGELTLQTRIGGNLDVYRIPKIRTAYATNGYQKQLTDEDSVIIFNNYLHTNSMLDIEMFAKRLYNLERIVDVNVEAQKTPVIIVCDENQRLTMKNLFMQFTGNEPFIFADKGLNTKDIKVLKTDAPFIADKIYSLKTQYWNEALTYLGITNVATDKKERLVTQEVTSNMGGVIACRYPRLQARKDACEKINTMFGTNIDVDYRDTIDELMGDNEEVGEVSE